ncbi:wee1-like protein kinase 1-B [Mercenaria mercenaria]|uniref:wee1-like protein kinase 1-B n=1 Tax=Mercenaria mercenaria TaxID=6596 RepID=UPI001E1D7A8C|nr:wee1-like protein kinase 1-B [Mercenaria mercenaria]
MALCKPKSGLKRKPFMKRREENLIRTLNFQDSDDGSGHDEDSISGSSPLWSPERKHLSNRHDESPEFLELDIPECAMISSPKSTRRFTRRRRFSPSHFGLEEVEEEAQQVPGSEVLSPCDGDMSPPHRKLRALRLFDTPHTPKSLLEKARRRRPTGDKPRIAVDRPQANVNPFTPSPQTDQNDSGYCGSGKRSRSELERSILDESMEDEVDGDMPAAKKLALHEINTSRYNEEFHEVCKLGDGAFGSVYKCVHRLDGCTYAIKKSKTPVAGSVYERNALNEVYAHAVLGKHPHVVRYYSAWAEEDHMYIQNEYCNGGSLADYVEEHRRTGGQFTEPELVQILYQVAQGLRYIHSQNLVHLDIKPGNIFIHRNPKLLQSPESGLESCEEEEEFEEAVIYKIGDLGLVTSVSNPSVEDGDCRYLASEILAENYDHLTKADIFSLGLTIFELGGGSELPKNGDEWHAIRRGELPDLPHYSQQLNDLLKCMVNADPRERPTALAVSQHQALSLQGKKSRAQLKKELNEERFKNQLLSQKLVEATKCLTQNVPNSKFVLPRLTIGNPRLLGNKMKRSMSLSAF